MHDTLTTRTVNMGDKYYQNVEEWQSPPACIDILISVQTKPRFPGNMGGILTQAHWPRCNVPFHEISGALSWNHRDKQAEMETKNHWTNETKTKSLFQACL